MKTKEIKRNTMTTTMMCKTSMDMMYMCCMVSFPAPDLLIRH